MKKRTVTIVIISIVVALVFIGAVTATSLAIWKEVKSKDIGIGITPEVNPSLRSQIFAPLDSSGNLISFENYNSVKHGVLQYSSITDKGNTLFYFRDFLEGYLVATQYAILNENLYVRKEPSPYNVDIHGDGQYDVKLKDGLAVYKKEDDGTYTIYDRIPLSNDGNNLWIENVDPENDENKYIKISKSELTLLYTTTKGLRFFYMEMGSLIPATAEQIIAGEKLYLYTYDEYVKENTETINKYGNIIIDTKTTNGFSIYNKVGKDYVIKHPTSLTDTENMFVGGNVYSYALVGYTGTVAELVVPSVYTDESGQDYSVTRICSSNDYADVSFENNEIITSIVIPASIESIADGTFANLSNLKTVYFSGTGSVRLGSYCFLACKKLETVYTGDGENTIVILMDSEGREVELSKDSLVFFGCESLNQGA